ncbi:MAG TPA: TlpA disulfide reductase family protein [Acidimicrobiales bacterium]|jgi:cytochrome c biogenesis protein CcmG/thiol:disulfide interchange protein DsbE|nr:TlpA disulfide reductase family protein [Acidimicrobiales bacterium]
MTRTIRFPAGRRLAIVAAALVVAALAVALAVDLIGRHDRSSNASGAHAALHGRPLPSVQVKRFDATGTEVDIRSLAEGKPMLINVWSSTCEPCKREMPALDRVSRQLKGRVTFVGVNVSDTADTGRRFFERYGATYLQVRDPRASLVAAVGSQVLPTTLIVDRNGDVVDGHLGALTAPEVRDLLQADLGIRTSG